jgi:hypothetical protein
MADKIFPEGIRVFKPRANAPKFVKGSVVVTPNDLVAWLKANQQHLKEYKGKKQLTLDLLEGKDGGLYMAVNTFTKENASSTNDDLPF